MQNNWPCKCLGMGKRFLQKVASHIMVYFGYWSEIFKHFFEPGEMTVQTENFPKYHVLMYL